MQSLEIKVKMSSCVLIGNWLIIGRLLDANYRPAAIALSMHL